MKTQLEESQEKVVAALMDHRLELARSVRRKVRHLLTLIAERKAA